MKQALPSFPSTNASGFASARLCKKHFAILCSFGLLLLQYTAGAQTIRYVKAGGTGNGSSWAQASGNLQAMVAASASGEQVWVAAGTYKPTTGTNRTIAFTMKEGVAVYGGFSGMESQLSQRPAITFSNPSTSVLSGDIGVAGNTGDNSYHVIMNYQNNLSATAVLDGFVITGGNANDSYFLYNGGGGLLNHNASPTVRYCSFIDNAAIYGGAVDVRNTGSGFYNCVFKSNTANADGGAVFFFQSNSVIYNSLFVGNYASYLGGAVRIRESSPTLTNCTFASNTAPVGGAMSIQDAGNPSLTNCIVWGNKGDGGELQLYNNEGSYTVRYSRIGQSGYAGQNGNTADDPSFVDPGNGDYGLESGSPLLNKGDNSVNATATDLDNNPRIFGSAIDMGAFELQQAPCVAPVVTDQPESVAVCTGSQATFSVKVTGSPAPTIEWQLSVDGGSTWTTHSAPGAPAFASMISVPRPTATTNGQKFRAVVTSSCGTVISNVATLTVNAVTAIKTQPVPATKCVGEAASFSVSATGAGLSYQWKKDGTDIPGATSAAYNIAAVGEGDATAYTVVVSGACGAPVTSNAAAITVNTAPVITTQPVDAITCPGVPYTLSVGATSSTALDYEWKVSTDGGGSWRSVTSSNAASITFTAPTAAMSGYLYKVLVTNDCSAVTSNVITLTVNSAPVITTQPAGQTACTGGEASFSIAATGAGLHYQWKKGGTAIPGATAATYTIASVAPEDATAYSVEVTGACGTVLSQTAALTVNTPPVLTLPVLDTVSSDGDKCGATVSFAATATGTPTATLSYKIDQTTITSPFFFSLGQSTVTATATNACGADTKSFVVVVKDKTPPEVSVKDATVYLDASGLAIVRYSDVYVSARDNCGALRFSVVGALNCGSAGKTVPKTLTVTDVFGNETQKTVQITVLDTLAPAVQAKTAVTLLLDASGGASLDVADVLTAASTDNCSIASQQLSKTVFTCNDIGENAVTLTVKDFWGNVTVKTINVTVSDATAPTVRARPVTVQLDTAGNALVTAAQVNNGSSDNCTPAKALKLALDKTSFTCANTGAQVAVTLTVTDASGNAASETALITVLDGIAPAVADLPIITEECSVTVSPINGTDNCTGTVVPTTEDPLTYTAQGTHTIHWTYSDGNGNSTVKEQTVVIKDVTEPVADVAALPALAGCSVTAVAKPTATDNCTGTVTATTTDALVYTIAGNYTITWSYSDASGNTSTQTQKVIVTSIAKPTITVSGATTFCSGGSVTLTAPAGYAAYRWSNGATTQSVSVNQSGNYSVTVSNSSSCTSPASDTVTVTVTTDTQKPVLSCPATTTLCYVASETYTIAPLQAGDNCGIAAITYAITGATTRTGSGSNASGMFKRGTSTITWTVKDGSGNTSTCQTSVVVNAKLSVSIPDGWALGSGCVMNTVYKGYLPASYMLLAAKPTGGKAPYTYKWSNGSTAAFILVNPQTATTYTLTLKDASGCTQTASKLINVVDVRCGSQMDKVSLCYNGKTMCTNTKDVAACLLKGAYLGGCRANSAITSAIAGKPAMAVEEANALRLQVAPNPSRTYFTLHISGEATDEVTLSIVDAVGRIIERRKIAPGSLQIGTSYPPGTYYVQAVQGTQKVTVKLMKRAY